MSAQMFAEDIRLVIWDLDETFWDGTLEEGEVTIPDGYRGIPEQLAQRGIISSICSKNGFEPVKARLEQEDLWKWFVFPQVDYEFKSLMIQQTVEQMGLRPETILFIDDNPFNRGEVAERIAGINVAPETIIPALLTHPQLRGKPDPELNRLERYKVLQMKQQSIAKAEKPSDFLRECEIQVSIHYDVLEQFDRIHDLVNRTNQLNFTKKRWNEDINIARQKYDEQAKKAFNVHTGYVKVRDKFGYYGICGFFEFIVNSGRAIHFLFSCRVLNMGVEQFIYQTLKYPGIQLQPPVVSKLERRPVVDWITIVPDAETEAEAQPTGDARVVALRGPCELVQSAHYVRPFFKVIEEFQYPKAGWGIQRPLLRYYGLKDELAQNKITSLEQLNLSADFPGLDFGALDSAGFDGSADVILFSFSMESEMAMYRHKRTGLVLPLAPGRTKYPASLSLPPAEIKAQNPALESRHLEEMQSEFEFHSIFDAKLLDADFQNLRGKLEAAGTPFIVIEAFDDLAKIEHPKYQANRMINDLARIHLGSLPDGNFIRLRDFVKDESQQLMVNHFQREVYAQLGSAIRETVNSIKLRKKKEILEPPAPALINSERLSINSSNKKLPSHNILFLHIPKTAGQSVHHFLGHFLPQEQIAPARVNEQLVRLSVSEMRKYKLYSGHLDWSLLDCLAGPKFTFTVLREPVARIVSFYLYLRREAEKLSKDELELPGNAGKKAVLTLSCDEYFTAGPSGIRVFLDNHYDNFYTYYFAGRRFDARGKLRGLFDAASGFTEESVLDMAMQNMKLLDGVYTVDRLDLLERDIRRLTNQLVGGPSLQALRVNAGDADSVESRLAKLEKFGATQKTFRRIEQMVSLDQRIWDAYSHEISGHEIAAAS